MGDTDAVGPPATGGPGLLVYFAGTSWDGNRGTDQHVAQRLSASRPVLYVDPPRSVLAAGAGFPRRRRPVLSRLTDRLSRLEPVAPPGQTRPGLRRATEQVLRRQTRAAVARLGGRVDVLVVAGLWPGLDVLPSRLRVLYGTDDFVAGAALLGMSRPWLERREAELLADADLVVTVSEELAERWRRPALAVHVLENGCDVGHFACVDQTVPPDDLMLPGPVAGFVGHLSDRIDLRLLEAVADGGHSLLLVGPVSRAVDDGQLQRLLARGNVQWVGAKPFSELPRYLGAVKVGLVPYADTAFNRASSPLKTFEYLAAGRAAVVTDLPAMRRLPDDVVVRAGSPAAFAEAVAEALAGASDPVAAARRRAAAAVHGWDDRVGQLVALLERTPR